MALLNVEKSPRLDSSPKVEVLAGIDGAGAPKVGSEPKPPGFGEVEAVVVVVMVEKIDESNKD